MKTLKPGIIAGAKQTMGLKEILLKMGVDFIKNSLKFCQQPDLDLSILDENNEF